MTMASFVLPLLAMPLLGFFPGTSVAFQRSTPPRRIIFEAPPPLPPRRLFGHAPPPCSKSGRCRDDDTALWMARTFPSYVSSSSSSSSKDPTTANTTSKAPSSSSSPSSPSFAVNKTTTTMTTETTMADPAAAAASVYETLIDECLRGASDASTESDKVKLLEQAELTLRRMVDEYDRDRNRRRGGGGGGGSQQQPAAALAGRDGGATSSMSAASVPPPPPSGYVPRKPDARLFSSIIEGWLSVPPPSYDENHSGGSNNVVVRIKNGSRRAESLLDTMEEYHEPSGAVYQSIVSSYCTDATHALTNVTATPSERSHRATSAAKSALLILNRWEDLFRETGGVRDGLLPAVSSYVTVMDVWKTLGSTVEHGGVGGVVDDNDGGGGGDFDAAGRRMNDAKDVVEQLRRRRVDMYRFDDDRDGASTAQRRRRPFRTDEEVLDVARSLLGRKGVELSTKLAADKDGKVWPNTWNFNLILDLLSGSGESWAGQRAEDVLDYMVETCRSRRKRPIKPDVHTVNKVMKAWSVSAVHDSAQRAEGILEKLTALRDQGILLDVNPDRVTYNTLINAYSKSAMSGSAEEAERILKVMEQAGRSEKGEGNNYTSVTPDIVSYASVIDAWARRARHDPGAARHAESILTQLQQRYKEDESDVPKPNFRCFNAVLNAYANSGQADAGQRALKLLHLMEELHQAGDEALKPTLYTLNIVMKALANSVERGSAEKAKMLLQRMEESWRNGNFELKPDLVSYNTCLDALAKSREKGAARAAEDLLRHMYWLSDNEKGFEGVRPDVRSYNCAFNAYSKSDERGSARWAEGLFDDLERRHSLGETDVRINTNICNALINCWAKSSEWGAAQRAEEILMRMEDLYTAGDSGVQPNVKSYCCVLDALARSKDADAAQRAMEILDRMEEMYAKGDKSARPNTHAYTTAIVAHARSRERGKAQKALDILYRMEEQYRKGNKACRPNEKSYNAVLNACAHTFGDEEELEQAFKIACLTFDEIRSSDYLVPNHVTYGSFLGVCSQLMPKGKVRDNLVQGVFRRCCRDGQVGDLVMRRLRGAAPPGLYEALLEGAAEDRLPEKWTENVNERHKWR